jgi:hypothetical protein
MTKRQPGMIGLEATVWLVKREKEEQVIGPGVIKSLVFVYTSGFWT